MNKLEATLSGILIVFTIFGLAITKKYLLLKDAYHKAETEKVQYCKENCQLRRDLVAAEYEAEKLFDLGLEEQND